MSSGGNSSLRATALPFTGGVFRAVGTGLPTLAAVFAVTGHAAIPQGLGPLSTWFPIAGAGCDLLAIPDAVELQLTAVGTVATAIAIPDAPALVGAMATHQLVAFELSPTLALTALTATNALQLTVGTF